MLCVEVSEVALSASRVDVRSLGATVLDEELSEWPEGSVLRELSPVTDEMVDVRCAFEFSPE